MMMLKLINKVADNWVELIVWALLFSLLLFGVVHVNGCQQEMNEQSRRQMEEFRARQAARQAIEIAKHVELVKLCLDKGGVPSVALGYRLERCDFPQEPARNAAESYCIEDKTTGKWYGPSFCAILERK